MPFLRLILLSAVVLLRGASASADDYYMKASSETVTLGTSSEVTLISIGGDGAALKGEIEGLFIVGGLEYDARLSRVCGIEHLGNETYRAVFSVQFPSVLPEGPVVLKLADPIGLTKLWLVSGPVDEGKPTTLVDAVVEEVEEAVTKERPTFGSLGGLGVYKPIYFLGGISPTDAKFQISLKYQLFNEKGRWALDHPWLTGFHLGYTQVSFWDLSSQSKPFEDTNFMPEVFYSLEGLQLPFIAEGSELDLQAGFLHESNGRDEFNSRSLNHVYGRLSYRHMLGEEWFARLTADAWSYVGSLSDNPDIADFRGHSSFQLTTGTDDGLQLSAYRRGRIGAGKASYLFDVTVPLKWEGIAKNLNFSLHGQLFTGYGENLLTYDQKETRFRFGLGIHR